MSAMPDTHSKRRRWFQFRLSTWFMLVGIVAWVMLLTRFEASYDDSSWLSLGLHCSRYTSGQFGNGIESTRESGWCLMLVIPRLDLEPGQDWDDVHVIDLRFRYTIFYPALALAAFLTWKAFWRIRERRRAKPALAALE